VDRRQWGRRWGWGRLTLVGKLRGEVPGAGDGKLRGEVPGVGDVAVELNREVRLVELVGVEGDLVVTREDGTAALQ
jgi:hypothetical protein